MAKVKLGRRADHRNAMLKNIVTSFLRSERIETTGPKAKALRKEAEKMITLAKRGDLHSKRQALSYLEDEDVVYKLFNDIAPRYQDRQGGYTRIIKKGLRKGDASEIVVIELV